MTTTQQPAIRHPVRRSKHSAPITRCTYGLASVGLAILAVAVTLTVFSPPETRWSYLVVADVALVVCLGLPLVLCWRMSAGRPALASFSRPIDPDAVGGPDEFADDPALLIDQAIDAESAAFDDHGISVVRDLAGVGAVALDRPRTLIVLQHLIRNAVQSLSEHKDDAERVLIIRLSASDLHVGLRLRIEVSDNGVGIAPQHLSRIFADGYTTSHHRRGNGLHQAFQTARDMHGTLSVASAGEGSGATFVLELPVHRPGEDQHSARN